MVINGEAKEKCVVKIWQRKWLETEGNVGGQTEISCPDFPKQTYNHIVPRRTITGGETTATIVEAENAINTYLDTPEFT